MSVPTIHIEAKSKDEIARTVLLPGDPLRAKFIAETYLSDVKQYNGVRNMLGFTGMYKGKRVSVQGSGIGIPSIGIYSYELFNFYDVENIIRVGTAGGIADDLDIGDVCIGMTASTNSNYAVQYGLQGTYAPCADFGLVEKAVAAARAKGVRFKVGSMLSSDVFYNDQANTLKPWANMGVMCVEMEAAALYMNANRAGKKALSICTVSDCPFKQTETTSEEREKSFTNMMEIALELA